MKMSKILEFLQEDNGGFSSSRLAFLLWSAGVLIAWGIISLRNGALQVIPESVATVIGILMTGKVVQKFGEKPSESKKHKSNQTSESHDGE